MSIALPSASPSIPSGLDTPWGRLRGIIDSLADGIVLVDRSGTIRFANPAAGHLFTRDSDTLCGTQLGIPVMAGETTEMEIVRRGGGEVVYAELRVVATDWDGETMELISLRDVTDRKYAEERSKQLMHEREARLQAEASSRAKSDFLAIMSHELRTPLNAILGYSELIDEGISGEVPDKVRDQIGRIRRAARHLLALVNDILDLAKVEAGRLSVQNKPANASDAISAALALVQPQADGRRLTLVVAPGAAGPQPYIGDDERVRQILVNLLSNAVKCTDAGGTITVDSELTEVPDPNARLQRRAHIRLTVTDTGTGIPADKLRAIFEPFVQADSGPARSQGGSGLGLTIGQRLARAMGGDLTVTSVEGQGSTFSLWLPADTPLTPAEGADRDDASVETSGAEPQMRSVPRMGRVRLVKGLGEVAHSLLGQLSPMVKLIVARCRCDEALPMAAGLRTSQVVAQLPALLADIIGTLAVIEDAGGDRSAQLDDSIEIQRLVAERHGAQRARLGWTEAALRREFMIIREEIERAVQRCVPQHGVLAVGDVLGTLNRFVDQAEYVGVRSLEKARPD